MRTTEIITTYAPDTDITFILIETYQNEDPISTEVVGFYYGQPNEEDTERYIGNLKAEY